MQATDIPADEVAAALKCLLHKPASDEAKQAQRAYRAAAGAAAEAAVSAAEKAAGAEGAEALLAVAACAAAAVEGFTSAQVSMVGHIPLVRRVPVQCRWWLPACCCCSLEGRLPEHLAQPPGPPPLSTRPRVGTPLPSPRRCACTRWWRPGTTAACCWARCASSARARRWPCCATSARCCTTTQCSWGTGGAGWWACRAGCRWPPCCRTRRPRWSGRGRRWTPTWRGWCCSPR